MQLIFFQTCHLNSHPFTQNPFAVIILALTASISVTWNVGTNKLTFSADNTQGLCSLRIHRVITPWPFRPKGHLSCPNLSVCPSVRRSAHKLYLVRTITRHRFKLEAPNLYQTFILGYSQFVVKVEVIDPDRQGHFGYLTQNSRRFGLSSQ